MNDFNIKQNKLLNMNELRDVLGGVSRTTVHRLMNEGKIPKGFKIGRFRYWPDCVINEFISNEITKRSV